MGKDQVIIYCGMHGLYEKANHTGYTNDPRRAGIYERSKVEDLLGSPYSDRKNELLPVPEDHETRIAERIASLNAERDALAAQNLELRMAIKEVHDTLTPLWRRIPSKTPDDPPIRSLEFTDDQVREVYDAIAVLRSAAKEGK